MRRVPPRRDRSDTVSLPVKASDVLGLNTDLSALMFDTTTPTAIAALDRLRLGSPSRQGPGSSLALRRPLSVHRDRFGCELGIK